MADLIEYSYFFAVLRKFDSIVTYMLYARYDENRNFAWRELVNLLGRQDLTTFEVVGELQTYFR